uniref:MotA/TolQ/ExbB proton channel family protein n=1 Tax=Enterobacter asburiae TaxID=61645 RepID=UPI001595DEF0|nr:MotA/TolQ/ExbB proton channel family protein [Enterobacter asburiae]
MVFVFVVSVLYLNEFIISAIGHNKIVNSVISILFLASLAFSVYSAATINSHYQNLLGIFNGDEKGDSKSVIKKIFGEEMGGGEEIKNDELLQLWVERTDWKSRILDYISGTLIGLGLLGTFIGLMETMGSISTVLGGGTGSDMVKRIAIPLSSMSSAFSASLMGLLSSLSVGFLGMLIDRLNSEFIDRVKSWFYNEGYKNEFYGMHVDTIDTLSQSTIKNTLMKLDAFCEQAECFLSEINIRVDSFKKEVAQAFDKITDEVINISTVTDSVNRCTATIIESNEKVIKENIDTRKDVIALNQLSKSLHDQLRNEILINRKSFFEFNKESVLHLSNIVTEASSLRKDILKLNKSSYVFSKQYEHYKNELTARMDNVTNSNYENTKVIFEIKNNVDALSESGRYNKDNIDRILTLQAINYDIGVVSLDEITKAHRLLDVVLYDEEKRVSSKDKSIEGGEGNEDVL